MVINENISSDFIQAAFKKLEIRGGYFMQVLLFIAIGAVSFLVVYKLLSRTDNNKVKQESDLKPCFGCKSSHACQHSNLGKASKDGKPSDMTYCMYFSDYVIRRDKCEFFLSHGCANGMCNHANHSNGVTFCSYYECEVIPSDSCPDYVDFFDTPQGANFLNSFK